MCVTIYRYIIVCILFTVYTFIYTIYVYIILFLELYILYESFKNCLSVYIYTQRHMHTCIYTNIYTHTCIYNVLLHSQKYILHHPQLSTYFQYNLCELGCSLESLSSWFRTGLEGNSAGRLMSRGRIRQL